jgi:hypothetical protein
MPVSRWSFSFDGGSATNSMSQMFELAARIAIPRTSRGDLLALDVQTGTVYSAGLTRAPTKHVAIGHRTIAVITNDVGARVMSGELWDKNLTTRVFWAAEAVRPNMMATGPVMRVTTTGAGVAALYAPDTLVPEVVWAELDTAGAIRNQGSAAAQFSISAPTFQAVGVGGTLLGTGGSEFIKLAEAAANFRNLSFDGTRQTLTIPMAGVSTLISHDGGVAGVGTSASDYRVFSGAFLSPQTFWNATSAEPMLSPVASRDAIFFIRDFGGYSVACRTGKGAASTVCHLPVFSERQGALALGAGQTLYVSATSSAGSVIQVRDQQTLALRDTIPLPGVVGLCNSLMPTCLSGNPVLGCVDSVGKLVFLSTDARGIDTTADWPMEGHDPSRTFNAATDLAPYACP